jgi:hypothetical protein
MGLFSKLRGKSQKNPPPLNPAKPTTSKSTLQKLQKGGTLVLRVEYWHYSLAGECPNQQRNLVELFTDYLIDLSGISKDYPWTVRPAGLKKDRHGEVGNNIVSIKVSHSG